MDVHLIKLQEKFSGKTMLPVEEIKNLPKKSSKFSLEDYLERKKIIEWKFRSNQISIKEYKSLLKSLEDFKERKLFTSRNKERKIKRRKTLLDRLRFKGIQIKPFQSSSVKKLWVETPNPKKGKLGTNPKREYGTYLNGCVFSPKHNPRIPLDLSKVIVYKMFKPILFQDRFKNPIETRITVKGKEKARIPLVSNPLELKTHTLAYWQSVTVNHGHTLSSMTKNKKADKNIVIESEVISLVPSFATLGEKTVNYMLECFFLRCKLDDMGKVRVSHCLARDTMPLRYIEKKFFDSYASMDHKSQGKLKGFKSFIKSFSLSPKQVSLPTLVGSEEEGIPVDLIQDAQIKALCIFWGKFASYRHREQKTVIRHV